MLLIKWQKAQENVLLTYKNSLVESFDNLSNDPNILKSKIDAFIKDESYVVNIVSTTKQEDKIQVVFNLTKDSQKSKDFIKYILSSEFSANAKAPTTDTIIIESLKTYAPSIRFRDLFGDDGKIVIDNENAKRFGISPGAYKLIFEDENKFDIYYADKENKYENLSSPQMIQINAKLKNYNSQNNEPIKNLSYRMDITFNPSPESKWHSSLTEDYELSVDRYKSTRLNAIKLDAIFEKDDNPDNRWDNSVRHNLDQSDDKNYITFKTNDEKPKFFTRVDFTLWDGFDGVDNKIIPPKELRFQYYSEKDQIWKNVENQNISYLSDFDNSISDYVSESKKQKYKSLILSPEDKIKQKQRLHITFSPIKTNYLRLVWIPQLNTYSGINEVQNSSIGFYKFDFKYLINIEEEELNADDLFIDFRTFQKSSNKSS